MRVLARGDRAYRAARVRPPRASAAARRDVGRQGQRARDLAALAQRRDAKSAGEYPDVTLDHMLVDAARCASRWRRRASTSSSPRTCSATSSRTRPARSGIAGPAAVGEPRHRDRSLRTGARIGARHRRQGHRQPDRRDRLGGDAAALRARSGEGAAAIEAAIEAALQRGMRTADLARGIQPPSAPARSAHAIVEAV